MPRIGRNVMGLIGRNPVLRKELAGVAKFVRRADRGRARGSYALGRELAASPFYSKLSSSLWRRLASLRGRKGQVRFLDKGTGAGTIAASVKNFDQQRIHVTAISLTKSIAPENSGGIDKPMVGFGIMARHESKFDIICDNYGEDYHLGRKLVGLSIEKSITDLKMGGELFTVIRLSWEAESHNLAVEEGRELVARLSGMSGITVEHEELVRRIDRHEYRDLVLHITRK